MPSVSATASVKHNALFVGLAAALVLGHGTPVDATGIWAAGTSGIAVHGRLMQSGPTRLAPGLEHLRASSRNLTRGTVLAVDNCNDAGPGSLREKIGLASEGDTVDLSGLTCATITLTTGQIVVPQSELTIHGPGRDALTIDANHAGRALYLTSKYTDDKAVVIEDLTIANGAVIGSGGCVLSAGHLAFDGVKVRDCEATAEGTKSANGGGIMALGNVSLANSIVSGNRATGPAAAAGGGVASAKYVNGHHSSIENNTVIAGTGEARGGGITAMGISAEYFAVTGNTATATTQSAYGGGIFASAASDTSKTGNTFARLIASRVSDNLAQSDTGVVGGGGIQIGDRQASPPSGGVTFIMASTISGNRIQTSCISCTILGGGVNAVGNINASYSTFNANSVVLGDEDGGTGIAGGGGLFAFSTSLGPGNITITQSTVSANRVYVATGNGIGGGLASGYGIIDMRGVTITLNSASTVAGGVHITGPTSPHSNMISTIVANNQAPQGADVGALDGRAFWTVDGHNNLVHAAPTANLTMPADTLIANPKLLPLANNGGLTETHALAACSPAINAGDAAGASHDQRFRDAYLRVYDIHADIGAFEVQFDPDLIFRDQFEQSPCP